MKILLKKIFSVLGLEIHRKKILSPEPPCKEHRLAFGRYSVVTNNAALAHLYKNHPEMNQALARLAQLVEQHCPNTGIIDVGANCGDTVALLRSVCHLPILAIEGDIELLNTLRANIAQLDDVTLLACYLGENTGTMSVNIEKSGWNSTLIPSTSAASSVNIVRLDEVRTPWLAAQRVSLLKCDTEGFDNAIIFGAQRLLDRDHPILCFEYNRENMAGINEPGLRIFPYLKQLGYEVVLAYDNVGRFVLSTKTSESALLTDLHDYADGVNRGIYYYDFIVFPSDCTEIARLFCLSEAMYRTRAMGPK